MSDFAQDRLKICSDCPYNFDGICGICGCELATKVKSPTESCPHHPSRWGPHSEPKVYKQPPQMRIAGQEQMSAPQPVKSNECIPCNNKHRH